MSLLGVLVPEIGRCEVDPVVVAATGAAVLDARIEIRPAAVRIDVGPRRLRGL
jgi:hypothetical protein